MYITSELPLKRPDFKTSFEVWPLRRPYTHIVFLGHMADVDIYVAASVSYTWSGSIGLNRLHALQILVRDYKIKNYRY